METSNAITDCGRSLGPVRLILIKQDAAKAVR